MGGFGGELWRDFFWSQERSNAGRTVTVNYDKLISCILISHNLIRDLIGGILKDGSKGAETRRYLIDLFQAVGERYAGELNTFKLDAIYAFKQTSHAGAYNSLAAGLTRNIDPLFLKESVRCAVSIHPRWRRQHGIFRCIFAHANPQLGAIETTTGGSALPLRVTNLRWNLPLYVATYRRFGRHVTERLKRHFGLRSKPALPVTPEATLDDWQFVILRSMRENGVFKHEKMHTGEIYNSQKLRDLIDGVLAGDLSRLRLIQEIARVESAIRAVE